MPVVLLQNFRSENIAYQLRDGNTILVPTDRVYDVRLMMATAGLPQRRIRWDLSYLIAIHWV